MDLDSLQRARASYARCQAAAGFFQAFYRNFFRACPAAQALFANTDFSRQGRLLQHGIGLLLSEQAGSELSPNLLDRIAELHGPGHLNIPAEWYPHFGEALVETVSAFDPESSPQVLAAWRIALQPGIRYMQEYGRGTDTPERPGA